MNGRLNFGPGEQFQMQTFSQAVVYSDLSFRICQ